MINVLQGWQEIGEAILELQRHALPTHSTPQKNWDHFLLRNASAELPRDAAIVDLGCGDGYTLAFLHALGFKNLVGLDLGLGWRLRARQLVTMWRERTLERPYRLQVASMTAIPLASASIDLALSVSAIEHGVDLSAFLAESSRVLKPGGRLFVTTDYWETKLSTNPATRVYGLPWQVFDREQVSELVRTAERHALRLRIATPLPACSERPVTWQGVSYTFVALEFRKA